jgi:hypothetical protein
MAPLYSQGAQYYWGKVTNTCECELMDVGMVAASHVLSQLVFGS